MLGCGMRAFIIILSLSLILFSSVSLADFSLTSIDSITVIQGSTKYFNLVLKSDKTDRYSISVINGKPWISILEPQPIVNAGEMKIIKVYLTPGRDVAPSLYKFKFIATNSNGTKQSKDVFVTVTKGDVTIDDVVVSGLLEPDSEAKLSVLIKNYGTVTVHELFVNISVKSPIETIKIFNESIDSLQPGEERIINRSFVLKAGSVPGVYYLKITLYKSGSIVDAFEKTFRIPEKAIIKREKLVGITFVGSLVTIKVKNVGNKPAEDVIIDENVGPFSIFYLGDRPDSKENGVYRWSVDFLDVGEEKVITYQINYLGLIVAIVIIAGALWYFLYKVKNVRIKKYMLQKSEIIEGSLLRIGLEIKNNTGKMVKNIVLRDTIPPVFKLKSLMGEKPKMRKTLHGIELEWNFKELNDGEVRLLSYQLEPVLGISGKVKLPRARAVFKIGKEIAESKSSSPKIGISRLR